MTAGAHTRGQTGGRLPETEENAEIVTAVPAGGRVEKAEETDAVESGAPDVRGDRVVEMIGRLEPLEVSERRGRNGRTSEGYLGPQPLARLTTERLRAQVAGALPEDRLPAEQYRRQAATVTRSPKVKAVKLLRDVTLPAP